MSEKPRSVTGLLQLSAHVLCLPLWLIFALLLYTAFLADTRLFFQTIAGELTAKAKILSEFFLYAENTNIQKDEKLELNDFLFEKFPDTNVSGIQISYADDSFFHIYKGEKKPEKFIPLSPRKIYDCCHHDEQKGHYFIFHSQDLPRHNAKLIIYDEIRQNAVLFRTKWVAIIFLSGILFLIHLLILKKQGEKIVNLIDSGLNRFLHGENNPKNSVTATEIARFQEKLQVFNHTGKQRILFLQLSLNFQKILNTPNRLLQFYLDEFYFLCRNLSENLHWEIVTDPEDKEDKNILEIQPDPECQNYLLKKTGQESLKLRFKKGLPIEKEIINIFEKYFTQLIRKSFLEEKKLELQAMKKELYLTRKVQNSILPAQRSIKNQHFEMHCLTQFDKEPTGDFFNIITFENTIHLYVADISRKDTGAILIATYLKSFFEGIAKELSLPGFILSQANSYLNRSEFENAFVTIFYCTIDFHTQILQYASAGHNRMFLKRQKNAMNLSSKNIPMGILAEHDYQTKTIALYPNDLLFLYSYALLYRLKTCDTNIYTASQKLQTHLQNISHFQPETVNNDIVSQLNAPPPLIGPGDLIQLAVQVL